MNKHPFSPSSEPLHRGALQIAGIYLLLGGGWILFSDRLAARVALNEEMLALISLYKGWGFVLVTAILLYWLVRRNTTAVQASREQLHRVIDAMPAFISYVDSNRRYRFTNRAYEEWFDKKVEGKHIEDLLGQRAYEIVSKYIDRALAGETVSYEMEVPLSDQERFFHTTYVPDVQADGQVRGFFVLALDRTEQKQAREELRQWADAFEGCAHGIAIGDPSTNRIVVCNPAFASLHKCRVEDIVGYAILSLYAPSDHEHVRRSIEKADQIGHVRFEAKMIRKDLSTFPVQMDVVSVLGEEGELLYRVVTAQDISERKLMDEKLKQSEAKYRVLVENLPAITYMSEPDQYIGVTYISPQIEALGFDADAWLDDPEIWLRHIHPEDRGRIQSDLQKFEAGAETFRSEYRLNLPNGETRWFHDESVRIKDQYGKTVLKQGFMLDITEQKQAQEVLRESEERYRVVSELTSDYAYKDRVEPDGRIVPEWITESFTRITGYSVEETDASDLWHRLIYPEDVSRLSEHIKIVLAGQPHTMEARVITKSGEMRWLRDHANPIWDAGQSRVVGLYGAVQDITRHKQGEENLRRFELLSEHSRDIILFINLDDGHILEANKAAVQAYEYSREELLGLTIHDLRARETQGLTAEQMAQADAGGILFETIHQRKDGTTFPVEVSSQGATIGGVRTLISIVRDISERKQTAAALQLKDRLLHLTSEMAKVGGWEFDPVTGTGTWTDEVARIHDLNPAQETNVEKGLSFYVGESRQRVEKAVQEAVEHARPYDLELEMVTAKGNRKWVRTMALPMVLDGKVVKVQGIFQDITERKQIERALQEARDQLEQKVQERTAALSEANALLQALMDNIPDHIYFKDLQSRFIRNSRSQATLLGLSDPAEAVGKTDFDFFPHAARSYAEEQEIMRSGKPLVDFEEWVVWPDGREMWVSTTKMPLRNQEGQTIGIFGISHDITERKRVEQAIQQLNTDLEKQAGQLQASNKELEAFSYSVSHDLRAPLRAIDGYTRILVEDYEAKLDDEGKRICSIISGEARRMGQLIDDLLAFSRLGRKEMFSTKIDMKSMVVSVLNELIKEEDRERLEFHIARLPFIHADSSLMRQVWVNLLSNAIKFTSKKERGAIEVGSKSSRSEIIYFVRDTGAGFDMEYANKLFGVFQRLHSENEFEGTGVGLAIVQRIIRRHGGRVWAEGKVDEGATFYFALPRMEDHHE